MGVVAAVIGALRVNVSANTAELQSGLTDGEHRLRKFGDNIDRLSKRIDRWGEGMQKAGRNLSLFVTAPLALFGRSAYNAAVDAEELQSAFNYSFGEMSDDMNRWAESTGDSLGRSTQAIQQMAFTFNQLFSQAAPTREVAAGLSQDFTLLAQDLASFYNVAEQDALDKLRAGLVGEAEPLRAFGVFLSAAAVEAKALEMGLAGSTAALTEQDKILARAAIIMEQTVAAQGDLTRTGNSAANQQRRLQSEFQEMSVTVGQLLMPVMLQIMGVLQDVLTWFKELSPEVQKNIVVAGALAAALGPLLAGIGSVARGLGVLVGILPKVVAGIRLLYLTLGPVGLALAGVSAAIYLLTGRHSDAEHAAQLHEQALSDLNDEVGVALSMGAEYRESLAREKEAALDAASANLMNARARLEALNEALGERRRGKGALLEELEETSAEVARGVELVHALQAAIDELREDSAADPETPLVPPIVPNADELRDQLAEFDRSLMTAEELENESFARRMEQLDQFLAGGVLDEGEHRARVLRLEQDHQEALTRIHAQGTSARVNDTIEGYKREKAELIATLEEEVEANRRAQEQMVRDRQSTLSAVASVLGQLANLIRDQGERQFRIAKGLAIAEALINVATGITKALAGPFPFINAALVAAAGAIQIAAIRRQQPYGAGSVTPPSGGGGAAIGSGAGGGSEGGGSSGSSGRAGGGATGGAAAAARDQRVYVEGISDDQLYSGRSVRVLVEKIKDYQENGGKVVLA